MAKLSVGDFWEGCVLALPRFPAAAWCSYLKPLLTEHGEQGVNLWTYQLTWEQGVDLIGNKRQEHEEETILEVMQEEKQRRCCRFCVTPGTKCPLSKGQSKNTCARWQHSYLGTVFLTLVCTGRTFPWLRGKNRVVPTWALTRQVTIQHALGCADSITLQVTCDLLSCQGKGKK